MLSNINFWVSLAFIFFIVLVYRPTKAFVNKALEEKSNKIKKDLSESAEIKIQAQALLVQCQQQKQQIATEIAAITERAREEVEMITQQATERLASLIKAKEQYIAKRLANQQKAMEHECLTQIVNSAFDLVEQKLAASIANDNVSEQLQDFDQALAVLFNK